MPRKPRIHQPAAFYHVMLRGNNGQDIFFSDADRCRFCFLVQSGVEQFKHQVHGFCLMQNHVHLVIQPGNIDLSRIVHHLAFRYARYINRTYKRIGHLFQGRFKAVLVDAENYLSELIRYVHLNPVRAGIVSQPENYIWSGHRAYMGLDTITWLHQDWILRKFHTDEEPARRLYVEHVQKGIGKQPDEELYRNWSQGTVLGDNNFIETMLDEKHHKFPKNQFSVLDLVEMVSHILEISPEVLQSKGKRRHIAQGRGIAAFLTRQSHHLTLKELGDLLEKDADHLSKMASTIEKQIQNDSELANIVKLIQEKLVLN